MKRWLFVFFALVGGLFGSDLPDRFLLKLKELNQLPTPQILLVSSKDQTMTLVSKGKAVTTWEISTAEKGMGQQTGSSKTPQGLHRVAQKIGQGALPYTIFQGRAPKGLWKHQRKYRRKDLVLTRILWLEGLEPGLNKGGAVDSHDRYIYIHATNHEERLGSAASHGCIRMSTPAILSLFEKVPEGSLVWIE